MSHTNGRKVLTNIYLKKFWREGLMSATQQKRKFQLISPHPPPQKNALTTIYGPKYLHENTKIKLRNCSAPEKHETEIRANYPYLCPPSSKLTELNKKFLLQRKERAIADSNIPNLSECCLRNLLLSCITKSAEEFDIANMLWCS